MAASVNTDKNQPGGSRYTNLTAGTTAMVGGNATNFISVDIVQVSNGEKNATIKAVTRFGCKAPTGTDYTEDAVGSRFLCYTLDAKGIPAAFAEYVKTGATTWKNITA